MVAQWYPTIILVFSSERYCCHHTALASFTFLTGTVGEHSRSDCWRITLLQFRNDGFLTYVTLSVFFVSLAPGVPKTRPRLVSAIKQRFPLDHPNQHQYFTDPLKSKVTSRSSKNAQIPLYVYIYIDEHDSGVRSMWHCSRDVSIHSSKRISTAPPNKYNRPTKSLCEGTRCSEVSTSLIWALSRSYLVQLPAPQTSYLRPPMSALHGHSS